MSVILSMPIHWLCSRLNSKFYTPMSPSPKHFDIDLTCDVTGDPEVIKICFLSSVFPGLSNAAWFFRIGSVVSEIISGLEIAPPPSAARYKNTPVGRGLINFGSKTWWFVWSNLTQLWLKWVEPEFSIQKNPVRLQNSQFRKKSRIP